MSGRRLDPSDVTANVTACHDDVTCRPFRVRPEARRIWQQHTSGTVGALLGQPPPPPPPVAVASLPSVPAGGADCVNAREKLRNNRSHGRHSGGGRQPMRALPINGVTEEALSHSKSSSSSASFAASPRSPRRHIDLSQLGGDLAAVEGVHGVRVISPGRQHAPAENGGIPSLSEGIPSLNGGIPSRDEGIPSPGGFRRVPSSVDIGSGSVSPGVTWSSSATELDRRLPRSSDPDRSLHPGVTTNGKGRPARLSNGARLPSPRTASEGIPSPAADPSWGGGGDRSRAVRLTVPDGDVSDRSSECDLRRERIRALIGSLRRPPTEDSARAVAADARELRGTGRARPVPPTGTGRLTEPLASRFSDETRLSFREQALERARVPYRAPSLAGSRKFKSSETLRDGAAARPAPESAARLLSRRKSQSVARLSRPSDDPGAARLGDKHGAAATHGAVTVNGAATRAEMAACATNGDANHHHPSAHHRVSRRAPDDASDDFSSSAKLSSHDASEPTKDFVRLNRRLVSQRSRRSRSQTRGEEEQQRTAAGRTLPGSLPRYLVRRQQQWQQEEERRLAAAPDPACPAGHSRMPDRERLQTLDVLTENHETLLSELRAMPIAHSSTRLVAQRADLERQLHKVEEGIRIFSRPKVFIKNDA